jgi:hypothetical protein
MGQLRWVNYDVSDRRAWPPGHMHAQVFLEKQVCDKDLLINILLTILGYIPGE